MDSTANPQSHTIQTAAGHGIVARLFSPASEALPDKLCIIAPATGVAQYLYDDFAHWLTEQSIAVITFDYHGIGLSVEHHVKHCHSDILGWANNDCPALLAFARHHYPSAEITWIGHSVGAHLLGMMPDTREITRAITVAGGTGTWWYNAAPTKRIVWFLWYFLVPATVPLLGYFPGNRLGVLCDLPRGVVMQWRRWCLKEDYAIEYEGDWLRDRFNSVRLPITAIQFSDDEMMSPTSVDKLHGAFGSAEITRLEVTPADIGETRIGHIGWHRRKFFRLWEKVFKQLLTH